MKLSAAIIAKDEEQHIVRCLQSIRRVVDEIVLVDTGSSDRTVELAQPLVDKLLVEPWRNDFSWHRNHSFAQCTGDWILQIDADEELCVAEGYKPGHLKQALEQMRDFVAGVVTLKNWSPSRKIVTGEVELFRLFRAGHVQYKRRIHNEPHFDGQAGYIPFVYLLHHGAELTEEQRKAKARRTIDGLLAMVQEDPNDFENHYYLANAYLYFLNDVDSAAKHAEQYIRAKDSIPQAQYKYDIHHLLANCYMSKQMYENALATVVEGLKVAPESVDLLWDMAMVGLKTYDLPMLLTAHARYCNAVEQSSKSNYRTQHAGRPIYHIDPNSYAALGFHAGSSAAAYGLNLIERIERYAKEKCTQDAQEELESRIRQFREAFRQEKEPQRQGLHVVSGNKSAYPEEIDVVVPWHDGNLGEAYNRIMRKARGWVCFLDHDVMQMHPDWYRILKRAVNQLGKRAGWISGVTNAIGCPPQLSKGSPAGHDILAHRRHAVLCYQEYGEAAWEIPNGDRALLSGFMILTHREAWEAAGRFPDGFLGVDNTYDLRLQQAGYKRYVLPGLYLYHTYRDKEACCSMSP